ncbi:MAG TPA: hypothetical protein VG028_04095 [Terriglobia bacterium]|nr:hypothetical protein [Terriglobia bacterium]
MAIITNPSFNAQNLELAKRPLYMVTIDGLPEPLTTFRPDAVQVTWTGYGLSGYGTTGYGG